MPSFPRIDSPCPLSAEEQRAIDGHCDRCDKHVHALNDMSEAERRALLANAAGPICVSYRKAMPRRVGRIGAAIAATLITTTAYAGDPAAPAAGQPTVAAALQGVEEPDSELDFVLITGGVNDPQDALAAEDTSVPELPIRTVDTALAGIDGGAALEDDYEMVMVGGIQKPGEAEWSDEDTSLPALPMVAAQEADTPVRGGSSDGSR